jgi:CRISPR-associated protein Cas1
MLKRIVEITSPGRRLSKDRGHLVVEGADLSAARVPFDDIEAVIVANPSATFTSGAVVELMDRGAVLVLSDKDFKPAVMMLPLGGHHAQGGRLEAQAAASRPLKKRLWAEIVRRKIEAQHAALQRSGKSDVPLLPLLDRLRSGDPGNVEAIAAQRYFPALFGKDFRRDGVSGPENPLLNYGYSILRAATARAIVGAGLHPSFSIHHVSRGDPLRLADDLMEPFRPTVDLAVIELVTAGLHDLDPKVKKHLAGVLHADFQTDDGVTTLSNALVRLTSSLAGVYEGKRHLLSWPRSRIPLEDPVEDRDVRSE